LKSKERTPTKGTLLKKLLQQFGIESERLRVECVSTSWGDRFATIIKDMVKEIKKLGPNPLRVGGKTSG